MLLLNPGPVTLTERVRRSLLQPDLYHRESEFYDLQDDARAHLLQTHDLDPKIWAAVLLTGSGTAAVESMIAALVPQKGRLLVVENGVYGERISQICARYHIDHERLIGAWMSAPDMEAIAAKLDAAGAARFTHLAIVHHETTTGRLNDLSAVAAVCRPRGIQLLIDGVSSFGAEFIDFSDEVVSAVAATANKCLHGVPGAAFVIVRSRSTGAATRPKKHPVHAGRACVLCAGRGVARILGGGWSRRTLSAICGTRGASPCRARAVGHRARHTAAGIFGRASRISLAYSRDIRHAAWGLESRGIRDLRGTRGFIEEPVPYLDDGGPDGGRH